MFHFEYLKSHYGEIDHDVVRNTINNFKANTFLLINGKECVGVLAGSFIKSNFNQRVFFQEIMWYVREPFGRYAFFLVEEVEKVLKSLGVSDMIMSAIESDKSQRIAGIYDRMGYKPLETHYIRSLNGVSRKA